MHLRINIINHN